MDDIPAATNDAEDKVIGKVAYLHGILQQLGFTLIEECLRSIKYLDLDDALEWVRTDQLCGPNSLTQPQSFFQLFLRLPSDELSCDGVLVTAFAPIQSVPPSPRVVSPPPAVLLAPAPAIASVPVNSHTRGLVHSMSQDAPLKSRIISYEDSGSDDGGEEDPNRRYADLKLRLSELQRSQIKGKGKKAIAIVLDPVSEFARDEEISQLQRAMKKLEGEYMFKGTIAGEFSSAI